MFLKLGLLAWLLIFHGTNRRRQVYLIIFHKNLISLESWMYDFKFGLFLEWSLKCTIDSNANVRNNDVLWSSCFNFFFPKNVCPWGYWSSGSEVFWKTRVFKIFASFRLQFYLKKIFCEFTKFLRTSFLQNTSGQLIASDISILGFSKIKLIKILSRYFYLIQAQFFHYKKPIDLFTVQINWVVSISWKQ